MYVTVVAFGEPRRYLLGGQPERTVDLPDGATLADLAHALSADPDELPLVRRDNRVLREGIPLREGDRLELFAPVGGG
ncbi:MAG: hypothetical protein OJF49_000365 [Ktedonobacterales bacterium]|jgi:sulfur carrier protein ThiS|nr:MAG: hypothetical protein OJF49_000365 [Ktedonobacterales bacterium]